MEAGRPAGPSSEPRVSGDPVSANNAESNRVSVQLADVRSHVLSHTLLRLAQHKAHDSVRKKAVRTGTRGHTTQNTMRQYRLLKDGVTIVGMEVSGKHC